MRLLIVLGLVLATPAFAQNTSCYHRLPPMQYNHEPTEPYVIHYVEPEDIRKHCNFGVFVYASTPQACTLPHTREVFIPNNVDGLVLRCLLTHEKAHLNGWPYNHPIR